MKIISLISQKGGAGKTSLTVHLAVIAEANGKKTAIIDLDPQGSASDWGESREADEPEVLIAQAKQLPKMVEAAQNAGIDFLFIDTAPHSESSALEAARISDLILIPCRPSILDIRAIKQSRDLALLASKPYFAVLNAVPPRSSLTDEARVGIESLKIPLCEIEIGMRQSFIRSLVDGCTASEIEPKGKAAIEIEELYQWLIKKI